MTSSETVMPRALKASLALAQQRGRATVTSEPMRNDDDDDDSKEGMTDGVAAAAAAASANKCAHHNQQAVMLDDGDDDDDDKTIVQKIAQELQKVVQENSDVSGWSADIVARAAQRLYKVSRAGAITGDSSSSSSGNSRRRRSKTKNSKVKKGGAASASASTAIPDVRTITPALLTSAEVVSASNHLQDLPLTRELVFKLLGAYAWFYVQKLILKDAEARISGRIARDPQFHESCRISLGATTTLSEVIEKHLSVLSKQGFLYSLLREATKTNSVAFFVLPKRGSSNSSDIRQQQVRVVVKTSCTTFDTDLDNCFIAVFSNNLDQVSATDRGACYVLGAGVARLVALVHRVARIDSLMKDEPVSKAGEKLPYFQQWAIENKQAILDDKLNPCDFEQRHNEVFDRIWLKWGERWKQLMKTLSEIVALGK